jgi:hypothetical protein
MIHFRTSLTTCYQTEHIKSDTRPCSDVREYSCPTLLTSRISLSRFSWCTAQSFTCLTCSDCSGGSPDSSTTSRMPIMAAEGFRKSWLQAKESRESCQESPLLLSSVKGSASYRRRKACLMDTKGPGERSSVRRMTHATWSERSGESPDSSATSRVPRIETNISGMVSLHSYLISEDFFWIGLPSHVSCLGLFLTRRFLRRRTFLED